MNMSDKIKWSIVIALGFFVGYVLAEIVMYFLFCKVW